MPGAISPAFLKGGIVLLDRDTGEVLRTIELQYNPETLTRSIQMRSTEEDGDRLEALRLSGPPQETLNLEALLDATDRLEAGNKDAIELGVAADIAVLETILSPSAAALDRQDELAARGAIEVLPTVSPLILFVWGAKRVQPVRFMDFSVSEELFDTALNPLRARITLGMRVLTINDLPFGSRGGGLAMVSLRLKETLADRAVGGRLAALGLDAL